MTPNIYIDINVFSYTIHIFTNGIMVNYCPFSVTYISY